MKPILGLALLSSLTALTIGTVATATAQPTANRQEPPPVDQLKPREITSCFQLGKNAKAFSKTPETLCVSEDGDNYIFRLSTGLPGGVVEVARFNLQLQARARCMNRCNRDIFGVSNPSNSVFNKLSIRFNGKPDGAGREKGTVKIGDTTFHYVSIP